MSVLGAFPAQPGAGPRWAITSVAGLVFMMPPVEVIVEQDDASRSHAGNDAPLVIGEGHSPDSCVTAWVGKELPEVRHLPHPHHTAVSSCEQVLPIPAQLHGPDVIICAHAGLECTVHAEGAEVAVLVEDNTVALS